MGTAAWVVSFGAIMRSTAAGSTAMRLPHRNAAWFIFTAAPLSSIALLMASADTGTSPF